jgi:hypothetical protein
VVNVDQIAHRYALVLLSRRTLRAFAAATISSSAMLAIVFVGVPIVILIRGERSSTLGMVLLPIIFAVIALFFAALIFGYIRALSALATGARRPISILLTVVMALTLVLGMIDVQQISRADVPNPSPVLALAALFLHVAIATALVLGPMEIRRADQAVRAILAEPRVGTGLRAEFARLLHLPDVRAFTHGSHTGAWIMVALSLLLEGAAFISLLKWPSSLIDIAERPLPRSWSASSAGVGLITVALAGAGLAVSFVLIRLLLKAAAYCRTKARRLTLQTADRVAAGDPRPPVFFLRSFEEEQLPLRSARVPLLLRGFDPGSEYRSLEEMIVMNLTYLGPVVAMADPSRPDAPVGAARWRLAGEDWRGFVLQKIEAAGLIVIGLAHTRGLRWEIEAVRQLPGALAKTIFVCPPQFTRSPDMWSTLAAAMGCADATGVHGEQVHVLMATRSADGSSTVFVASSLTEMAYYVALRACLVEQRRASGVETAVS